MVADKIPHNLSAHPLFKEEEDEISDKELARSYIVKINEDLKGQVHQLSQDNGALKKEAAILKGEILKNSMA